MTRIVVSAYNAAPAGLDADTQLQHKWYKRLRDDPRIGGLELAFAAGCLHAQGNAALAGLLDPAWRNSVSLMPFTLARNGLDPAYGLASLDDSARRAAVDDVRSAFETISAFRHDHGDGSITSVGLQSAPRADRSSPDSLRESLSEITAWNWDGVGLLLEHSDALRPGQKPEKGYLDFDAEWQIIHELNRSGAPVRHLLNWGRSAIEGRSDATPLAHLAEAGSQLGAYAFSGASGSTSARSVEWQDVHLGLARDEPVSLLDEKHIRDVIRALPNDLSYLGVKVGAGAGTAGVDRLDLAFSLLSAVEQEVSVSVQRPA
ncbi:DUF4862 family protein [Subtercola frigoramans]|uniref:DUF4862 family protein n=1 Tax=Subtercola frigoramans TaxID=120298 RepID=A0ABS2L1C4_9MICO|nr:DUF4862 family protein [Subtercola frigoramans]MBM7470872.1 hypothetical protein [Subtercola frigoramans]